MADRFCTPVCNLFGFRPVWVVCMCVRGGKNQERFKGNTLRVVRKGKFVVTACHPESELWRRGAQWGVGEFNIAIFYTFSPPCTHTTLHPQKSPLTPSTSLQSHTIFTLRKLLPFSFTHTHTSTLVSFANFCLPPTHKPAVSVNKTACVANPPSLCTQPALNLSLRLITS